MLILETLWQPSGKDVLGRINPIALRREATATSVDTTVNIDFDDLIDTDQVFVLHHYVARFTPGAVTSGVQQQLLVRDVRQNLLVQTVQLRDDTGSTPFELEPTGGSPYTIIFGGEGLRFNGVFSGAPVGGNVVTASIFGIVMPRGNWQRG